MIESGSSRGHGPLPPKGLLERAADLFDFRSALGGGAAPALTLPVEESPPAPVADTAPIAPEISRARDWGGPMVPLDRAAMAEQGFSFPDDPVSELGEEFHLIKRALMARLRDDGARRKSPGGWIVQVTSTRSGEGKTFCAVNLALSLAADAGAEVLLVDADLANPEMADMLGLLSDAGLNDALADPALAVEDFVVRTDVPGLAVLPAGRSGPNDTGHLASGRMNALLAALVAGRPERILVLDSPPLLAASAASGLAGQVDQTILVVRADSTTDAALRDAAGLLGDSARVSLILNRATYSASGRRFGAYPGAEG